MIYHIIDCRQAAQFISASEPLFSRVSVLKDFAVPVKRLLTNDNYKKEK